MKHNDFAVFILTHGRYDRVYTYDLLRRDGYTGKIYLIIDNIDDEEEAYKQRYGEQVIVFDKEEVAKTFDVMDNFNERRTVVYARNACFEIAKSLGLTYFLELDDDYTSFMFRFQKGNKLGHKECKDLDKVFDAMLDFLDNSNALSVCFAQGGDFIGGLSGGVWKKGLLRKVMNTFFCRVDRPFKFIGNINEDVNTYVTLGHKGELFFTVADAMITQVATQQNAGGMSTIYLDTGTYVKSFYSVICCPSGVTVATMGGQYRRIHHRVSWNNVCPKIIDEKWQKK